MKQLIAFICLIVIINILGGGLDDTSTYDVTPNTNITTTSQSSKAISMKENNNSEYSEEDFSYNDKVNYNLYDNSYNTNYSNELKENSTISWKCVGLMADGKAYMYNIIIQNNNTVPTYNFIVVGGEGQTTIKGSTTELFPVGQLWLDPGEVNHVMICADSPDYIPDILVAYDD